jgi:hypothetical protein
MPIGYFLEYWGEGNEILHAQCQFTQLCWGSPEARVGVAESAYNANQ